MGVQSMLKLDLQVGESVKIGSDIVITLEKKTGQVARLSFEADRSIPIRRIEREPRKTFGITGEAR